jgi:hypothetical protein
MPLVDATDGQTAGQFPIPRGSHGILEHSSFRGLAPRKQFLGQTQ